MGVARYRVEEDAKRFGEEWIRGGGGGKVGRVIAEMKIRRDQFPTFLILSLLLELFPKS